MSSTSRETNTPRQIGPVGTLARVCVGTGLLIFGLTANPTVFELLAGFVVLPTAEMLVLYAIRPQGSEPVHLYGVLGQLRNSRPTACCLDHTGHALLRGLGTSRCRQGIRRLRDLRPVEFPQAAGRPAGMCRVLAIGRNREQGILTSVKQGLNSGPSSDTRSCATLGGHPYRAFAVQR